MKIMLILIMKILWLVRQLRMMIILKIFKSLIDAGVDVLVIDIAHGHSIMVPPVIANIKNKNIDIIAGKVATKEGEYLAKAGADGIKVNIGAGSVQQE